MIYIQIASEFVDPALEEKILQAAEFTLQHQKLDKENSFSVVIEGDQKLQELNSQFRQIDAPTDVLSFSSDEYDPDTGETYIGDIIISFPRAKKQAEDGGHKTIEEIQLLTIHGILHLLGYDHLVPEEKEKMWQLQSEILALLGVRITITET